MTDKKPISAVVIYAAKSTEDKHGSIPTQIEDCRALAAREGWEIVGEFSDEAFSAFSGNRGPGLEHAKALATATAAERGRCVLVAQDADRFARGAGDEPGAADHVGEVYFAMKRCRVELWTVRSGHLDLLRATIEGERSHDETDRKAQATKDGLRRRKERGQPVGPIPVGYTVDKNIVNAARLIDPVTASLVERIYAMVERGATFGDVARTLNADGIRTRPRGNAAAGCIWTSRTVRGIVHNDAYAGEKGYPALIDPDRWQAIVGRLKRMDEAALKRRQGGRKGVDPAYFLRGIAFCGKCGASLYTREQAIGPKLHLEPGQTRACREIVRTYVCKNRREGTGLCDAPPIQAALIEDHILRHLKSFVAVVEDWLTEQVAVRDGEHQTRRDALDTQRAGLVTLDRERERHFAAYRAMIADEDPLARYALEELGRIDVERAAQERAIADAQAVISEWAGPPDVDAAIDFYNDVRDAIHGRIEQAAGVRELNQALSTVVAGLWAEIEGDRLLVEFEVLHLHPTFRYCEPARMGRSRPTLPPRRLDDTTETPLVILGPSPSNTTSPSARRSRRSCDPARAATARAAHAA
jgi:DNA invertase Pin-like site-specific DNA recombinase